MEGKLLKVENGYVLLVGDQIYTTDSGHISIGDCKRIDFGYDLDEMIDSHINSDPKNSGYSYMMGFMECVQMIKRNYNEFISDEWADEDMIRSINRDTNWDVLIETTKNPEDFSELWETKFKYFPGMKPKLDDKGRLIIKKK